MKEDVSAEVIAFFARTTGDVEPESLIEIVPTTWPPIAVHIIRPGKDRPYFTLFTTGMSNQAMKVPEGSEDFRFAELYMQVPADWPIRPGETFHPDFIWVVQWLRQVAGFVHESESWLGGPVTIFANSEPPEPLAPDVPFTSLLLLAKENFISEDGRTIHLYLTTPLHTEERNLEIRRGIAALMRLFDQRGTSFVVDLNRKSVAKDAPFYARALVWLGCSIFVLIPICLLLWIWVPGMGWMSLAGIGIMALILVVLRLLPDWNEA